MFGYVDNGFPVWMINNRGTEYSRRHTIFTDVQQDYWSFDIFDQYQDIKANIDIIKAYAGYDIMWYVGYSGGTTQMIYGMSQDEPYLANRIQKAILLAPCTIIEPEKKPPGALEIFTAQVDVYEFSGPSWKDDKQRACTVTSVSVCEAMDEYDRAESTSVMENVHMAQIAEQARFQEFVDDWPAIKEGIEIDLDSFESFPLSYHVAQFDDTCKTWYAEPLKNTTEIRVPSKYTLYINNTVGHNLFTQSNNETSSYQTDILDEIYIEPGYALNLKTQGTAYLKRSGGYFNPAADYESDFAQNGIISTITVAVATTILASVF